MNNRLMHFHKRPPLPATMTGKVKGTLMPPMHDASEKEFQTRVMRFAREHGWVVFHPVPSQVRPGVWRTDGSGFPDLVLAHYAKGVVFAELKTRTGKLRAAQDEWELHLAPHVEYHVWRPADWDEIVERLT